VVLDVDDWVETNEGNIGLVTDVSRVRRAGGEVVLYSPEDHQPHVVDVDAIRGKFPTILRRTRSM